MNRWHSHLIALLLIGMVGLAVYGFTSEIAFPAASLELKLPRAQIQTMADSWALQLGYDQRGSIESTIFTGAYHTRTFLEYELGLARANELMKATIPAWFWETRMCRY